MEEAKSKGRGDGLRCGGDHRGRSGVPGDGTSSRREGPRGRQRASRARSDRGDAPECCGWGRGGNGGPPPARVATKAYAGASRESNRLRPFAHGEATSVTISVGNRGGGSHCVEHHRFFGDLLFKKLFPGTAEDRASIAQVPVGPGRSGRLAGVLSGCQPGAPRKPAEGRVGRFSR